MVGVPPKCGTLSFRLAMMPEIRGLTVKVADAFWNFAREKELGPFSPSEAAAFGLPMYLAVRHPVERFRSLWQDLQRSNVQAMRVIRGISPEGLLKVIEAHPEGNDHWIPQSRHYVEGVTVVPYSELLKRLELPFYWRHKTDRLHVDMPSAQLREIYRRDMELWQDAIHPERVRANRVRAAK